MGLPLYASTAPSVHGGTETSSNTHTPNIAIQSTNTATLPQMDGGADYHSKQVGSNYAQPSATNPYVPQQHMYNRPLHQNAPSAPPPPHQQTRATGNVVRDLLPYCTIESPLNEAQVIALSDVVGSLRELVLLALSGASGDRGSVEKLEGAVGQRAAKNIIDFFVDEWEIEG
jgi:hypothetical protein